MNEVEQFLKDTEQDSTKVDVLEATLIPDTTAEKQTEEGETSEEGASEKGDVQPRNRRERRLMEKLSAERESASFLAGKLEARTEAERTIQSEEKDYLKFAERIYGTDSPEAALATDLLKKAITGARDDAENRAYERMREDRKNEIAEEQAASSELDQMVDHIEDEYNVTLTANQETAFFQLLQKMSPKDSEGNVREYADPDAVWEVFAEKLHKPTAGNSRAKDLSSRSMVNSGASKENTNLQDEVHQRFLREQGII